MIRRRSLVLHLVAMLFALAMAQPLTVGADPEKVTIRCDKHKTIGDALAQHQGGPLTIEVVGMCLEHVTVRRSDVTLVAGASGGAIQGTDPKVDTLAVTADRFVLDGLSVTGGRNGIVVTGASQAQIRNCSVRATGSGIVGGIGILFSQGASGSVDACDSSGNPADGIMLDGAVVAITNSKFKNNARNGVFVFGGSTSRIGFTNAFASAPNTISDNGGNGIHLTQNSLGLIYGNTVKGNGTNPNSPVGRFGVLLFQSRADLPGRNTITENFGAGIVLTIGSTAVIGDPGFGLPSDNTISGNSTAAPSAGILFGLASSAVVRNATIQGNNGAGLNLAGRSTVSVFSGTVTNHTIGLQLSQGAAAVFQNVQPLASISGNTNTDLLCLDGESSFTGPLAGNPVPTITCTGF